jgi:hypothetical protein
MREKLNSNPALQIGLLGVLGLLAVVFLLGGFGGGGEEEAAVAAPEAAASAEVAAAGETSTAAVSGETSFSAAPSDVPAPPLPVAVRKAYADSKTIVLLVVRGGGVDDPLVARATRILEPAHRVAIFVTRAKGIARYAAITLGLDVDRIPALVVLRPKNLSDGRMQGTVSYGFRESRSVIQAVADASYKGPELAYHPN